MDGKGEEIVVGEGKDCSVKQLVEALKAGDSLEESQRTKFKELAPKLGVDIDSGGRLQRAWREPRRNAKLLPSAVEGLLQEWVRAREESGGKASLEELVWAVESVGGLGKASDVLKKKLLALQEKRSNYLNEFPALPPVDGDSRSGPIIDGWTGLVQIEHVLKEKAWAVYPYLKQNFVGIARILDVPLVEGGNGKLDICWDALQTGNMGEERALGALLEGWMELKGLKPRLEELIEALDLIGMKGSAEVLRKAFIPGWVGEDSLDLADVKEEVDSGDEEMDEETASQCGEDESIHFQTLKEAAFQSGMTGISGPVELTGIDGASEMRDERMSVGTGSQIPAPPITEKVHELTVDQLEIVNLNLINVLPAGASPEEDGGNVGEFSSDTAVDNEQEIDLILLDDPNHPGHPLRIDEGSKIDMDHEVRPATTSTNNPSAAKGPRLQLVVASPKKPRLKTPQVSVNLAGQENSVAFLDEEKEEERQQKKLKKVGKGCPDFSIAATGDSGGSQSCNELPRASYDLRRKCSARLPRYDSDEEVVDEPAENEVKNNEHFKSALAQPPSGQRISSRERGSLRRRCTRRQFLIKATLAKRSKPEKGAKSSASVKQRNFIPDEASSATTNPTATAESSTALVAGTTEEGEKQPNPFQKKRKWHRIVIPDHITIHEVNGELPIYQCSPCNRKFKTRTSIRYHQFCGTGSKPLKCETCGKGFIVKRQYVEHQRTHTGEKPHVCPECQKGFSRLSDLTRHLRSHTGGKHHVCPVCTRGFVTAQVLRVHSMIHTGEQPFACIHCDKRFFQKKHLKQHLITHTGERRFSCNFCGKSFGMKQDLDTHLLRIHSKERPYACDQCTKAYGASRDLRRHMQIHSDVKPFGCGICQSSFTQKCDLNRHIKNQHSRVKQGANVNEQVA